MAPDLPLAPDQSQAPPTGLAAWRQAGNDTPWVSSFNGASFATKAPTFAKVGSWRIMAGAEAPTRAEAMLVGVDVGGNITGQYQSSVGWLKLPTLNANKVSETYWWGVDADYESASGDALVVWNNNKPGSQLHYATFDGKVWSAPQPIVAYTGVEPQQMHLAASPTSDEMVLVVNDAAADHRALVWSGSSWGNPILLDASGTTESDQTALQAAYEQKSGHAMVVYGKHGSPAVFYRSWDGVAWSAEATLLSPSPDQPRWLALASHAGSDALILGVLTGGPTSVDVWLCVWNGSSWGTPLLAENTATGALFPGVAVAFEGASGQALAVYGQSNQARVRYRTLTGVVWSAEQLGPDLGQAPNTLLLTAHPGSDRIMLAAQDDDSDVSYALWDGASWGAPIQLEADSGEVKNQPFLFLWDR